MTINRIVLLGTVLNALITGVKCQLAGSIVTRSLLIQLNPADYNYYYGYWDNIATSGTISTSNGDFLNIVQGKTAGANSASTGVAAVGTSSTGPGTGVQGWAPATFPSRVSGPGTGPSYIPAVTFDYRYYGVPQRLGTLGSSYAPFGGLYLGSNWTFEYWIQSYQQFPAGCAWSSTATTATFGCSGSATENPVLQWGIRPGSTCNSAFTSLGMNPGFGEGGHWSCDNYFNQTAGGASLQTLTTGGTTGATPTTGVWHHIVTAYDGAGNEFLYLNGQLNWFVKARTLSITKGAANLNGGIFLGAWYDSASTSTTQKMTFYVPGVFTLGTLRVHDGMLLASEVLNNYNVEAAYYRGSPWDASCPTTFSGFTHTPQVVSIAGAAPGQTRTFLRHACFYIYNISIPVGTANSGTNYQDTTVWIRPGYDGFVGSVSFSPVGWPGLVMAPQTAAPASYVIHQDMLSLTNNNASMGSWLPVPSATYPGAFVLQSRHPSFFGYALTQGVPNTSPSCSQASNQNVQLGATTAFTFQPGLAYLGYGSGVAVGQPIVSQTNNLYVQSASVTNAALTASCGGPSGGLVTWSTNAKTTSNNTIWSLVPPLSCSTTCNTFAFSLASLGTMNGFLYVNASGAVKVGNAATSPDFTTAGASFTGQRVFRFGVPGWVIASSINAASGNILTRTVNAGIGCSAGYYQLSMQPPNASGISLDNMWWLNWEDGGSLYADIGATSNIATLPNNTYAYAPACGASSTPTPSGTPTGTPSPSQTPSNTPSGSYTPTQTQTPSITPTPTVTPTVTSLYASGCPSSFVQSHFLNVQSITMANDTSAYIRHCNYWWFSLVNFPTTDLTAVQDATCVMRLGADGTPNSVTLQSANYQAYQLMVTPSTYMQYTAYGSATKAQLQNMTFNLSYNPDGSFNMTTHVISSKGVPLTVAIGTIGTNQCSVNKNAMSAQVAPAYNLTAMRFAFQLSAPSAWSTPPYTYQTIIMDSLAGVTSNTFSSNGAYSYGCGGGAVVGAYPGVSWQNASAQWTIVPALACPAVCGYQTFSLQALGVDATGLTYLYVSTTTGRLTLGSRAAADFTQLGASFLAYYATVSGTSGWVVSSALDYGLGNVLTNTLTPASAACGGASASVIQTAAIPTTGLGTQHLWHLFWADGAGDLLSIPNAASQGQAVASATYCATPSVTPTLTNTPTASNTPSRTGSSSQTPSGTGSSSITPTQTPTNTASASVTASASRTPPNTASQTSSSSATPTTTASPSVTPSQSGSPSSTQVTTLSNTPSSSQTPSGTPPNTQSATSAATPSMSGTAATTPTRSITATTTPSAASTPSQTPSAVLAVAGSLWVSLWASDYNAAVVPQTWDNRASAGPVSFTNGDFVTGSSNNTFPSVQTLGGVTAVVFNVSADGVADSVSSAFSYFPITAFYQANSWSVEYWVYHTGWESSGYNNAIGQLAGRPGTTCDSFSLNMGSHPTWGDISFWSCDYAWVSTRNNPVDVAVTAASGGWRPLPFKWHHVVYTYSGATGQPPYVLTMYLNGVAYRSTSIQLAIKRNFNPTLGTWSDAGNNGNFGMAQFHIHSGALTAAQVAANYYTFALSYDPTQTSTSTPSPTSSVTPSPSTTATTTATATGSPSGTQLYSLSATPSSSQTPTSTPSSSTTQTPSITPSPSTAIQVSKALLVDLHASDFNTVTGHWDNVATAGTVSLANGDFVSAGISGAAPSLGYVGPVGSPAIIFNSTVTGSARFLNATTSGTRLAGIYGASDWSIEWWGYTTGWTAYANGNENPVMMWSPRPASTCQSGFTSMGNDPTFGAGGHYNCDDNYGATTDPNNGRGTPTVLVTGKGYTPNPYQWHHIVVTYTGSPSPIGVVTEAVYVDGQVVTQVFGRSLNIQSGGFMHIGAWNNGGTMQGGNLAIGELRIHDGYLTASQVAYNYAAGGPRYQASPTPTVTTTPTRTSSPSVTASQSSTQLYSFSQTPSNSPTPSGTPCPSSFGFTHVLNATAITSSLDSTQYIRHACYYVWATSNYPVGNTVYTMDATHLQRMGLDGTSGSVSFQSDNYQNHWLQVQANGWLTFIDSPTVFATNASRAAATFSLSVQRNGNVQLLSHHPSFYGWAVSWTTNINGRTCGTTSAYGPSVNVTKQSAANAVSPSAWTFVPPLASYNQYSTQAVEGTVPFQSERVVIESIAYAGKYVMVSGGGTSGSLIVDVPQMSSWVLQSNGMILTPSFSWLLAPALGCPNICVSGVSTLSLLGPAGSNTVVFDYGGGVYLSGIGSGYSVGDASLVTYPATVNGVTGYVLSSYADFAVGNVWTVQPSGAIISVPIPASGLSAAHLFRIFWEDGSGDLLWSGFPSVPGVEAGQPACPSMSVSPVPTTTQTPTQTPSNPPSPSVTPSASLTPSNTPSGSTTPSVTPSPSYSPTSSLIGTPSNTPSGSASITQTPTVTASASTTASPTTSSTSSLTSSATPSPSTQFASNLLLVDLRAEDFVSGGVWRNRAATASTPSYATGSFAPVAGKSAPFAAVIDGVPAVVFWTSGAGVGSQYSASSAAFPTTGNTIWSGFDWSVEFWVYSDGSLSSGGYAPVFQWGARPGTTCDSACVGVGANTVGGASSFYNCDAPWSTEILANGGTTSAAGFGQRPAPLMWHHVVFTYTGTTSSPQLTLTQYLDGQVNSVRSSLSLAIRKDDLRVGSWTDISANVSISQLRVHNGALTAAQVAYNYAQFAPFAVITATSTGTPTNTPTQTATPTSTRSSTSSVTASPSSTQILSPTSTAAATTSPTASLTSTSSIQYQGASNILIYLNADDFNAATGAWDNRATSGAVSYANGDFVPDVSATSANWPTAGVAGNLGHAAVVFNVTTTGAAQYLVSDPTLPSFAGLFGNGAWTYEAWVVTPGWNGYHNAGENPVFQWGAIPSTSSCGSAFFGVGSDPTYGAGGHYTCDIAYAVSTFTASTTSSTGTSGYMPIPNAWTHIVVTYAGGSGAETLYINGEVNHVVNTRTLNIQAASKLLLGAYNFVGTIEGGNVAIGILRVYDAALTAAQVQFNLNELAAQYIVSPSNSPTRTATPSQTPSQTPSATPTRSTTASRTSTKTSSVSLTPSVSASGTAGSTTTTSPSASASASITSTLSNSATSASSFSSTKSSTASAASTRASSPSAAATTSPSPSSTHSSSSSASLTPSATTSPSSSASSSSAQTTSPTGTRPPTHSSTRTSVATKTSTAAATQSCSASISISASPTKLIVSPTATGSATASLTAAATSTRSATLSATRSMTASVTPTKTRTGSITGTKTPTASLTPSKTPTASKTATKSRTSTVTGTKTKTGTPTPTKTSSPTKKAK